MAFGWFPLFLMLFIAFPIAEIALLIVVGEKIGLVLTLGIVIGTAVIGTTLLRAQGFGVLSRVNKSMNDGEMPLVPVMEGMFLLIAGAFLLTPGLITDAIGFILLVPPFRIAIARWIMGHMLRRGGIWQVYTSSEHDGDTWEGPGSGEERKTSHFDLGDNVIEGEFTRVGEENIDPDKKD